MNFFLYNEIHIIFHFPEPSVASKREREREKREMQSPNHPTRILKLILIFSVYNLKFKINPEEVKTKKNLGKDPKLHLSSPALPLSLPLLQNSSPKHCTGSVISMVPKHAFLFPIKSIY